MGECHYGTVVAEEGLPTVQKSNGKLYHELSSKPLFFCCLGYPQLKKADCFVDEIAAIQADGGYF